MRIAMLAVLPACIFMNNPGTTNPGTRTCDEVESDLANELDRIQTCDVDGDCGQVLTGTSCGCTRDLVARGDADLADFDDLVAEADAGECEAGFGSVCDCPEAAGFRCDEGTCAWNYLYEYPFLPQCETSDGAPVTVNSVVLDGDDLVADVTYSGGCFYHEFVLCWPSQSFAESEPVQAMLELYHDDAGDKCDGKVDTEVRLSVTPLEEAYEDAYQSAAGTVRIQIHGTTLDYTF